VIGGPKRGFTLPFEEWLPRQLRPEVEETLANQPAALRGVIDAESVRTVWRSFLAGKCSWTRPWSLYVLYKVVGRIFNPGAALTSLSAERVSPAAEPALPLPA
jgi:hypothetical protein